MAKNIELLLLDTIENLGIVGDVVKVKPGYARNYLLPHGLAEAPTEEKIAELAERRAQVAEELKKIRNEQEALLEKITDYELTLERSANEQGILFGGVSQHDISEALQAEGFAIKDSHVRIGEKINRLDTYHVPIQLAKDLKCEIKLWVVSDQPLPTEEDEAAEGEDTGEAPAEEAAEAAAE